MTLSRLLLILAVGMMSGCYNIGFNRGVHDWNLEKKGKQEKISSYRRGYLSGITFMKTSDELDVLHQKIKDDLEKLKNWKPRTKQEMDDEIDNLLKDYPK